jgi:hypothetical protein
MGPERREEGKYATGTSSYTREKERGAICNRNQIAIPERREEGQYATGTSSYTREKGRGAICNRNQ